MTKKKNFFISAFCFFLGLFVFGKVQDCFKASDIPTYQSIHGLYEEPKNSIDSFYIGSSNVYYFWQSPIAWADHGITVWNYNSGAMPAESFTFLMTEARKTQSDPLFIINLNNIHNVKPSAARIHRVTHYLRPSFNKLKMISSLAGAGGFSGLEKLEFYFPLIRFHSRWSQLNSNDFDKKLNGMKLGLYSTFFYKHISMNKQFTIHEGESELGMIQAKNLDNLLNYCDANHLKVLFVVVPQAISASDSFGKQLNRMESIVRARGYDCLNLMEMTDEIGIRLGTDFRDNKHTNVHGAIKFTEYLAQYLIEHYGFEDKRGSAEYESWDRAAEIYFRRIGPYTLPFEREHSPRDYSLRAPKLNNPEINGQTINLSWGASENAAYYEIYRESSAQSERDWRLIAAVGSDTLMLTDENLQPSVSYTYTVVPVSENDGVRYYGNFDYSGVKGTIK